MDWYAQLLMHLRMREGARGRLERTPRNLYCTFPAVESPGWIRPELLAHVPPVLPLPTPLPLPPPIPSPLHQLAARAQPDPSSLQYGVMCSALLHVVGFYRWSLDEVYVWVDYVRPPHMRTNSRARRAVACPAVARSCVRASAAWGC